MRGPEQEQHVAVGLLERLSVGGLEAGDTGAELAAGAGVLAVLVVDEVAGVGLRSQQPALIVPDEQFAGTPAQPLIRLVLRSATTPPTWSAWRNCSATS